MNTPMHSNHPLQPLWNLAAAPMQVQALQQAVTLQLFDRLERPMSSAIVAQTLTLQPDSTAIWLDLLWSMGLLHRHADLENQAPEYAATDIAMRYFRHTSPQCCAPAWQARADFLADFSTQWETLLRQGISTPEKPQPERWAQAARSHLGLEQRAVSAAQIAPLLDRLPSLPAQGRFADVGGGPGHVAIALAQHLPHWQGVVLEQGETTAVAQENIHAAGLHARLSAQSCNINHDNMGSGYDLIWCSSVLHFVQQPAAVVQRLHDALAPDGRLLLAHAELANEPSQAAQTLPFYAGVMLRGGTLPHARDVPRWMQAAGLSDIRALGSIPWALAPLSVHTGRRAA